jgi:hypothetical protein
VVSKPHLRSNACVASSFKIDAHPAYGGTALSRSACALPLNLICGFEATADPIGFFHSPPRTQKCTKINAKYF